MGVSGSDEAGGAAAAAGAGTGVSFGTPSVSGTGQPTCRLDRPMMSSENSTKPVWSALTLKGAPGLARVTEWCEALPL